MTGDDADVVVLGGGPAGLAVATELARRRVGRVLVLEREAQAGGIPRHSDHLGYGIRDLHRLLSGPDYARRIVDRARAAGATVSTSAMVTDVEDDGTLWVTSPAGRYPVRSRALVLATGARERPRAARLVPGDRGAGVLTTGQLQNLVHLHGARPGRRAVVVGAEPVSWSAVLTLREARCEVVAVVSRHRRPESYAAFTAVGRLVWRTPVVTGSRVVAVHGRPRVTGVEVEEAAGGRRRLIECDTVVFTGDWIPDNEIARSLGLDTDPRSKAPVVDDGGRTSRPGVFAAGNLVHPVDTADVAALGGRHAAVAVQHWLEHPDGDPFRGVPVAVAAPLRWVSPAVVRVGSGGPARRRLIAWSDEHVAHPRVEVAQDGRVLRVVRLPWPASPGRAFRIPSRLLDAADPAGGPIRLAIR